jgi:hypothetical protein
MKTKIKEESRRFPPTFFAFFHTYNTICGASGKLISVVNIVVTRRSFTVKEEKPCISMTVQHHSLGLKT